MSKYIDAEQLWKYADNQKDKSISANDFMRFPYIDIVRCQDCKYCLVGVATAQYSNGKQRIENLCEKHKWSVRADDFCSYGERSSE